MRMNIGNDRTVRDYVHHRFEEKWVSDPEIGGDVEPVRP